MTMRQRFSTGSRVMCPANVRSSHLWTTQAGSRVRKWLLNRENFLPRADTAHDATQQQKNHHLSLFVWKPTLKEQPRKGAGLCLAPCEKGVGMAANPPNGQWGQPGTDSWTPGGAPNDGVPPQATQQSWPAWQQQQQQQPQHFGSPPPHQPPPSGQRPQSRSHVGAIIAVVLGAILLLGGLPFGLAIGGIASVPQAFRMLDSITEVTPSGTVTAARSGDAFYLLAQDDASDDAFPAECSATGPSGERLHIQGVNTGAFSSEYRGNDYVSIAIVRAEGPGEIQIQCVNEGGSIVAAPAFNFVSFFTPFFWWTIGGVVATVAGIVLVVIGIVLLVRRPREVAR